MEIHGVNNETSVTLILYQPYDDPMPVIQTSLSIVIDDIDDNGNILQKRNWTLLQSHNLCLKLSFSIVQYHGSRLPLTKLNNLGVSVI